MPCRAGREEGGGVSPCRTWCPTGLLLPRWSSKELSAAPREGRTGSWPTVRVSSPSTSEGRAELDACVESSDRYTDLQAGGALLRKLSWWPSFESCVSLCGTWCSTGLLLPRRRSLKESSAAPREGRTGSWPTESPAPARGGAAATTCSSVAEQLLRLPPSSSEDDPPAPWRLARTRHALGASAPNGRGSSSTWNSREVMAATGTPRHVDAAGRSSSSYRAAGTTCSCARYERKPGRKRGNLPESCCPPRVDTAELGVEDEETLAASSSDSLGSS